MNNIEKYKIVRPPINKETFEMPNKQEIENLQIDSIVKVMFVEKNKHIERMWCKVKDILDNGYITAILLNEPVYLSLHYGDIVKFHVTDIIAVW